MSLLHLVIILPFLFAICIPLLHKLMPRIHTGWFLLPAPVVVFVYMLSLIPSIQETGGLYALFRGYHHLESTFRFMQMD